MAFRTIFSFYAYEYLTYVAYINYASQFIQYYLRTILITCLLYLRIKIITNII